MVIQIVFEDSQLVEMASKHLANFAKKHDIPKKMLDWMMIIISDPTINK